MGAEVGWILNKEIPEFKCVTLGVVESESASKDMDTSANPDPADNEVNTDENPESTKHDEKRKKEGRSGKDARRDIGDANRVRREGTRYVDTETGNVVYVGRKGHTVILDPSEQRRVTRNTYSRRQVQERIDSGKWRKQ